MPPLPHAQTRRDPQHNQMFAEKSRRELVHLEVLAIKRQWSADQCVKNDPQAPDIHLRPIILLALKKFRGGIRGAAAERVQLTAQCELVTEAEVRDFNVGICIEQKVFCLRDGNEKRGIGTDRERINKMAKIICHAKPESMRNMITWKTNACCFQRNRQH